MHKMQVKKMETLIVGAGAIVIAIVFFAFAFPRQAPIDQSQKKLKVVATLFPLYDFARQVGGDNVDVSLLLPPGVEAHSFEPRPSDIVKINESGFFVYTGKFMEPWAADLASSLPSGVAVVDASMGIVLQEEAAHHHHDEEGAYDEDHENEETVVDPHIWLDFDNSKAIVLHLAAAMSEKDPDNAASYRANAGAYADKLDALDAKYRSALANCASREFVYGGHYAFGYMARRYGLSYLAAQGVSPDSEPTIQDLSVLVEQIRKEKIAYIFYEAFSSSKIAQTIAGETGAKILLLNAAHNVSRDDIERGSSFIDIMEFDLNNLKVGLECQTKT